MKKYCLNNEDYAIIYDGANKEFKSLTLTVREDLNHKLAYCIVNSFLAHLKNKNLIVKDGTIYENEEK